MLGVTDREDIIGPPGDHVAILSTRITLVPRGCDPNVIAARLVRKATGRDTRLPEDEMGHAKAVESDGNRVLEAGGACSGTERLRWQRAARYE
jgi:hypothetical protein